MTMTRVPTYAPLDTGDEHDMKPRDNHANKIFAYGMTNLIIIATAKPAQTGYTCLISTRPLYVFELA